MIKLIKYIKCILFFLWAVIIFHEIIPHHHPENDKLKIEFSTKNNSSENKNDEGGILDDLLFHRKEVCFLLKSVSFFVNVFYFSNYNLSCLTFQKLFIEKPIFFDFHYFKEYHLVVSKLRGPPSILYFVKLL